MWGEQRLDALPMKKSGCVVVQSEVWRKANGHGHGFAVGSRSAVGVERFGEITNFVLDLQSQTEGAPIWGDACTCLRMMLWRCTS